MISLNTARLFALGAIWGSSFLCIEIALAGFAPISIAALRIGVAAGVLLGLAILRGDPWPTDTRTLGLLAVAGGLNSAVPFFLIGWGQQFIPSNLSAVLMATSPIVALVLAHFATRDDRITPVKVAGVLLGFSGVIALVGVDALQGMTAGVWGQLAVTMAAVCYVSSAVISRRVTTITPLMGSAVMLGITAVYMLPLAFWWQPPTEYPRDTMVLTAMLYLALAPTALAYLLRFQLIQSAGVTFMAQVAYLIPMFGVFWSWLFLEQVPSQRTWFALALILTGVYVARLRPGPPGR